MANDNHPGDLAYAIRLYRETKHSIKTICNLANVSKTKLYGEIRKISLKTRKKYGNTDEAIKLYLDGKLRVSEICKMVQVPRTRLYEELEKLKISKRQHRVRVKEIKAPVDPRQHERRDCQHFMACLDVAYIADDKCLPCKGCDLYQPGGTADLWEVEIRGGTLR